MRISGKSIEQLFGGEIIPGGMKHGRFGDISVAHYAIEL